MEAYCTTPAEAFCIACSIVQDKGSKTQPRNMATVELLNLTLHVSEPAWIPFNVEGRELNMKIAALEILQLVGQHPADALARRLIKPVAEYQDYSVSYGNYGARLRGQLTNIVKELRHDGDSRRAVATIYNGRTDLGQDTRDIPCTLSVQFFIRDAALQTRVCMRSNDAWLGLPYDLQQFCALHCAMAEVLSIAPGSYAHSVGSMHLYERNWAQASMLGDIFNTYSWPLFGTESGAALKRLEDVTGFCQDVLAGENVIAKTDFSAWLLNEVSGQ
jgi:thymidylate synthase